MTTMEKLAVSRKREQQLEQLSPFELKDNLIKLASNQSEKSSMTMLNAGRGNPNWTATTAREAFFTLGQFGISECRLAMDNPVGMGGIPQKKGCGKRLEKFLRDNKSMPGVELLRGMYKYGIEKHQYVADEWAFELAEGVIGDQYPSPVRMLAHLEPIVHDYLIQEMCGGKSSHGGRYNLFATEGGTAAMCYIFDSLVQNGLLKKGDKIALGTPIFTPYLEIPHLDKYGLKVVHINGSDKDSQGNHTYQYPDTELDKLGDKTIKAFFLVNPSNPTSVEMAAESRKYLIKVVKHLNPNLMILTDDVYGTFVPGFRSLLDELPRNTLCVYSFSKYFGATGWRLGVIALHENNIYDDMISALPQRQKQRLSKQYESLTINAGKLKFIDRLAADSRDIALNHTAGLSTPQQVQMAIFAAFALLDQKGKYKDAAIELLQHRYELLFKGMGEEIIPDRHRADYYCEIDIQEWAIRNNGKEFFAWLKKNFEPVDMVFRLAEKCKVVLLNGGGFAGPEWSVRVSLANLNDNDYTTIGKAIAITMQEYLSVYEGKKPETCSR